jgi:hypothetical protein
MAAVRVRITMAFNDSATHAKGLPKAGRVYAKSDQHATPKATETEQSNKAQISPSLQAPRRTRSRESPTQTSGTSTATKSTTQIGPSKVPPLTNPVRQRRTIGAAQAHATAQ